MTTTLTPFRFQAPTSREALRLVREQLGPDAMVLSSQVTAEGVEVLAVVESAAPAAALRSDPAPTPALPQRGREPVPASNSSLRRDPSATSPNSSLPPRGRAGEGASSTEAASPSSSLPPWGRAGEGASPSARPSPAAPTSDSGVLQEIHALRAMIETQLAGLSWSDAERRDPLRGQLLRGLLASGISARLGQDLLAALPAGLNLGAGQDFLKAALARRLPVLADEDKLMREGGVYALVGPTGVGKTTTTAKLAARCVMRFGPEQLALVTTDTYRMGAAEQLRLYGEILGVPVYAVKDAGELDGLLTQLRGKHMVLIDTVGMSQRDRAVAEQIALLAAPSRPVKRLLLLNAASHGDNLQEVVAAYQRRAPGQTEGLVGCIFTKLDEAAHAGALIDVAITHQLPVHYLCDGQRVPEHLHLAGSQALAERLFEPCASVSVLPAWHSGLTLDALADVVAPTTDTPRDAAAATRSASAQLLRSLAHDSAELAAVAQALIDADAGLPGTRQAWRQWSDPHCPADLLVQTLQDHSAQSTRWQSAEVLLAVTALTGADTAEQGSYTVYLSGHDGAPVAHGEPAAALAWAQALGKPLLPLLDQAPDISESAGPCGLDGSRWLAYAGATQRLLVGGQSMALSRWLKASPAQGGPVFGNPQATTYRGQAATLSVGEAQVELSAGHPVRCLVQRVLDARGRPLMQRCALASTALQEPADTLLQWAHWRSHGQTYFKLMATSAQQLTDWPSQPEPDPAKSQWLAAQAALTVWHLQSDQGSRTDWGQSVRPLLAQLAGRPHRAGTVVTGPTLLQGLGRFVTLLDALQNEASSELPTAADATGGRTTPLHTNANTNTNANANINTQRSVRG